MRLEKRLTDLEQRTGTDTPALIVIRNVIGGGHAEPIEVLTRVAAVTGVGDVWQGEDEAADDFYVRVYAAQITGEIQPFMTRSDLDRVVAGENKEAAKELAATGSLSGETYERLAGQVSFKQAMARKAVKSAVLPLLSA